MSHRKVKYESYKADQFPFGRRAGCVLCRALPLPAVIVTQGNSELSSK